MFTLNDYERIVGKDVINQIYRLAENIKSKKLLHINSTKIGGGVAEILNRLVPLMNELGIQTSWEVIKGDQRFFEITKSLHNALQGTKILLKKEMLDYYININEENAKKLNLEGDVIFIHDPQPAGLIRHKKNVGRWVWRCHIDVSKPERNAWKFIKSFVSQYDASIFSLPNFAQNLSHPQYIIHPSIDPLSDKNINLSDKEIDTILERFKIDREKPIILQVSRFDRFKDPLGVIEAYKNVKKYIDCQLILAGGGATDDPEGEEVLNEVMERGSDDKDIHILHLPPNSNREINALQRGADIVVQKSLKEGFGLTVTEAMWKGKPVVGGGVGGITNQIIDYRTGFLIHSIEGAAYRIRYLLNRPELARRIGSIAKEYVRRNFLITRHIRDYLFIMITLEHVKDKIIYI
jgi:trehalose synthase